jgi:two-component sensor histidine kinase
MVTAVASTVDPAPSGLARIFSRRRVVITLWASAVFGFLNSLPSESPTWMVVGRTVFMGFVILLAFGLFERWPKRIRGWLPRLILQILGIVIAAPIGASMAYVLTTGGRPDWANEPKRVAGFSMLVFEGVLFAPWIALVAMVRQRDLFAHSQALAFELEKSKLERTALDAQLRLMQAQVEPHFLFNTLANVQALVDAGSPQASKVLNSLIAYLRAAVPRLHERTTTMFEELQLVRAYLEVMHMRMPDRLQFELRIEEAATGMRCPPMTLLTLVENAVRHGIDPSEEGGRIDIHVQVRDGRVRVRVADTGVGLGSTGKGLGTGLSSLRERLQLAFGGDAQLRLTEIEPHGVCAELDFPARKEPT